MPLSTVLGAQSLIKPGVCTTATRPASPYTGQAIYDTTVSQVLVYNGTAFASVSGLVRIGGGTLSGSATTFSSIFSSTYDVYSVILSNVSATSGDISLTLGSTSTGYYYSGMGTIASSGANAVVNGNNVSSWRIFTASSTAAGTTGSIVTLVNPNKATATTYSSFAPAPTAASYNIALSGGLYDTTAYTAFTVNGTGMAGTVNIYGYSLS